MAVSRAIVGRKGPSATKFEGTVEGGPELAKAFAKLDDTVRVVAAKDAVAVGLRYIGDQWSARAPVGTPEEGDEHPGAYRDALRADDAVRVGKTSSGASGTVGPRRVAELGDEQQPYLYAGRLEFGDRDRTPEPSARPAFDQGSDQAVELVAGVVREAIDRAFP